MYCPTTQAGAATLHDVYGRYLHAQLSSDPRLAGEAAAFRTQQESLKTAIDGHHRARGVSFDTLAARDRARVGLAEAIGGLAFTLRRITRNDFKAPLYQAYFPEGTGLVTATPVDYGIEKVENILAKLATETNPLLTSHTEPLTMAMTNLKDAVRVRRDARVVETNAFAVLQQEKKRWIEAYRETYAKVLMLYKDNPRKAEDYFRKIRQKSQKDDAVTQEPGGAVISATS